MYSMWWIKEPTWWEGDIQYDYLDMTAMPNKTMTYLRCIVIVSQYEMYCNSFRIVLHIIHSFSNSEETMTHFNPIWIVFIYYIYIIIIIFIIIITFIILESERKLKRRGVGGGLPPKVFLESQNKKFGGGCLHPFVLHHTPPKPFYTDLNPFILI